MKFINILFIFIFYIGIVQNNTVPIQDPNFEQALIDLNIDNSLNGQVQLDAIDSLTSLDVSGKNIVNFNGIQNFTSLDTLKASNNQLSFIDVSDLDSLKFLDASSNNLSDFALNSSIEELKFQHNQLEFVDLSNFGNLVTIILNDNNLKELNIKNGNNLNYVNGHLEGISVNFNNNPLLECIKVDNIFYMYVFHENKIDLGNTIYSEVDCVSYCDFPTTAPNDFLTGTFIIRDKKLPSYYYDDTYHYPIDFLGQSQLRDIYIGNSSEERWFPARTFPNLLAFGPDDFPNDTIRLNLKCDRVNMNYRPALQTNYQFNSYYENIRYKHVTPNDNYVTSIDPISDKKDFVINYRASPFNTQSDTIIVDRIGSFELLKISDSYVVNDTNFEQKLIELGHDHNLDGKIWADNIYDVKQLDLENENISDLTGIEGFRILETLNVSNNNIANLNLDNNYHLKELKVNNNNLTALNLEAHQSLEKLQAENNNLTTLNIKNNHNDNFEPNTTNDENFNLLNNPNLNCIDVSDENHMNTHFSNYIDASADFSEIPCETMNIASFDNQFRIYPNPANSIINVKMNDQSTLDKIEVFNLNGRKISRKKINADNKSIQFDVINLSSGLYFIKLSNNQSKTFTKKLIISN